MAHAYRCAELEGMSDCPGYFVTGEQDELWQILEVHGRVAHDEDPAQWTEAERGQIAALIRPV